jgi:hypothetical protein
LKIDRWHEILSEGEGKMLDQTRKLIYAEEFPARTKLVIILGFGLAAWGIAISAVFL